MSSSIPTKPVTAAVPHQASFTYPNSPFISLVDVADRAVQVAKEKRPDGNWKAMRVQGIAKNFTIRIHRGPLPRALTCPHIRHPEAQNHPSLCRRCVKKLLTHSNAREE